MVSEVSEGAKTHPLRRLLREPTLHFFAIAAAALLAQRLIIGDPHTIEITPALRADLVRRYHDQLGRVPAPAETEKFLAAWKVDEALYREALRQGIDRDDQEIRFALITKLQQKLMLNTRVPEPTEADLQQFLDQHRADFEAPRLFEHEYVVFPKREPGAEEQRAKYARQLRSGATTAMLGLRSTVANVDHERIVRDFGPALADRIPQLPIGEWQELETDDRLLLVKLIGITGGLPEPAVLRERLVAGFKSMKSQQALEQATLAIAQRYRFEEKAR